VKAGNLEMPERETDLRLMIYECYGQIPPRVGVHSMRWGWKHKHTEGYFPALD